VRAGLRIRRVEDQSRLLASENVSVHSLQEVKDAEKATSARFMPRTAPTRGVASKHLK
jgi:hypothetical protein